MNHKNRVVYSQHPYCCVNKIILRLFLKQSKCDVLICLPNLFYSYGAAKMNDLVHGVIALLAL